MKKLLSGITAMVLVIGLFTTGVQAKGTITEKEMTYEQVVQMMERTNKEIYQEIDKAIDEANNLGDKNYDKELDKIIDQLLKVTDKETEKLIKEAEKNGYIVGPEWVDVEIGNRTVSVDPCIGIGF
jgi:hypothetical protein